MSLGIPDMENQKEAEKELFTVGGGEEKSQMEYIHYFKQEGDK